MKKFMNEFREFITRGDVMSMAIGIIIGGAFTAIVNSLVNDIVTPLIGMIVGGIDFSGIKITVGDANLMVGNFIQAVIVFLITSLVIFIMIKAFNRFMRKTNLDKLKKKVEKPEEPEKSPETLLLEEIRDTLKENK